ncbi:helix-turn-helix domain-containing protein [Peptoniphilus sp. KCTC 25270]|uniref:helix-turn-helix domain-containing protein n=1 Tax=Peptoniphilus sp. KCTC 25270 TaxID=2897414 RepID=UPI001E4771E6|nr:helix-turn-helix transcriptional regulator [Peptoniphilus sp. KCTC 25270]MCD1146553.1 helix-turn-helix domain-containing protein [Peptoniphilus sp. KCTC 25270]
MILADKIIEERKKNGWSQEELAERMGVSRQAVSKWESAGAIPDLKKIIQLASLFGVSTDYLLKDDMGPENLSDSMVENVSNEPIHRVTMEEANEFLDLRRTQAPMLANAVSMCILSPVVLVILANFSESKMFQITEGMAVGIGGTILFAMIAAAVFIFITSGIKGDHMEFLEEEYFDTEYGVTGMVKEKDRGYKNVFAQNIALGVVLCIVGVIPIVVAGGMNASDSVVGVLIGLLLFLIAIGVNRIVRVSIIKSSYETLLQEGEFTRSEKRIKKKMRAFSAIYWCVATAIYLGWSFWTGDWGSTWMVWPVAGVLFAVVPSIVRLGMNEDE